MKKILNKFKGWKLPLLGFAAFIFALISVFNQPKPSEKLPYTIPPVTQFENSISGIGVVEPKSELVAVGAELPGVVRHVYVKVGDDVKKNDPIFSLDERAIDAEIKVLEANLIAAKIQVEDTAAQFEIANNVKDDRVIAKDEVNKRKFSYQLAQARVNEVIAKLNQAIVTKDRLVIKAPIDGKILKLDLRSGEYIGENQSNNLPILMGDMSLLHVRVELDEENASKVAPEKLAKGFRRGDTRNAISLIFVGFEPYIRPKQNISNIGQRIDTRILQVIYALPSNQQDIFVGQQIDVFIDGKDEE